MILDSDENKQRILAKFLEICPLEGFSDNSLSQAMILCKIDTKYQNLIFENGCFDLILYYIDQKNANLSQKIAKNDNFSQFKIRDKIRFALYELFENEKENRLVLQRLQQFYLNIKKGPRPVLLSLQHIAKISDFIWRAIGDKSTDFNFYTKRLTLSKIILQTFFVFMKDDSQDLYKTKKYIDLQIEKVMKFEKFKVKIKNISLDLKEKSQEIFIDENKKLKSIKRLIKDLPFIRLFN